MTASDVASAMRNELPGPTWKWMVSILLVPAIISGCLWVGSTIMDHSERLARIEANRFTATEAGEKLNSLQNQIDRIGDKMDTLIQILRAEEASYPLRPSQ